MKRVFKIIAYIVLLFFIIFSIWLQIENEKYIKRQKSKYGILKNRNRISYKPTIVFLFERFVIGNKETNKNLINIPYKGIHSRVQLAIIDEYILECYYSSDEKEKLILEKTKY